MRSDPYADIAQEQSYPSLPGYEHIPIGVHSQIEAGLKSWENMYGRANKSEGDLPKFMRLGAWKEEEYPIGSEAPEEWGGPRKKDRGEHPEAAGKTQASSETMAGDSARSKKRKAKAMEQAEHKVAAWLHSLPTDAKRPRKVVTV